MILTLISSCRYLGSQVGSILPSCQKPLTARDRRQFYLMKTPIRWDKGVD